VVVFEPLNDADMRETKRATAFQHQADLAAGLLCGQGKGHRQRGRETNSEKT